MGSTRERIGADGSVRYTALYRDLKGRQRSAGTFTTQRQADRAWQRAEAKVAQGHLGEPGRGRQTFRDYVEKTWLPNHEIEATTRQSYTYMLRKHILPEFGPMRMIDILPEHVREWVTSLKRGGVKPPTIRYCFVVLSAIFTTALNDQVTFLHPCKGVKTPPVPAQPRTIITPEQFAAVYECLPDEQSKLLVETDVESGLRWGELTELRVRDLDFATRMLTVSRAVVQVHPKFHPEGGRFLVKPYPKDKEYRDGHHGDEPDRHRVADPPVVVRPALHALDRGQFGVDRAGQPFQHPPRGHRLASEVHRLVKGVVEAFHPQGGNEQAEIGGRFDAVGQLQLQVAELVGDAFQHAAPVAGGAAQPASTLRDRRTSA